MKQFTGIQTQDHNFLYIEGTILGGTKSKKIEIMPGLHQALKDAFGDEEFIATNEPMRDGDGTFWRSADLVFRKDADQRSIAVISYNDNAIRICNTGLKTIFEECPTTIYVYKNTPVKAPMLDKDGSLKYQGLHLSADDVAAVKAAEPYKEPEKVMLTGWWVVSIKDTKNTVAFLGEDKIRTYGSLVVSGTQNTRHRVTGNDSIIIWATREKKS